MEDIMETINKEQGNRLIALRKKLNIKQIDFAAKLGITSATVSAIELGKNKLTEQNIKFIALTFGVNEEWLRDGTGEMFTDELSKDEVQFIETFKKLSQISKNYIKILINDISNREQMLSGESIDTIQDSPSPGKNENVVADNAGESDDAGEEQEIA
jgi:transcriptional regulator with XRE-family HTH domain